MGERVSKYISNKRVVPFLHNILDSVRNLSKDGDLSVEDKYRRLEEDHFVKTLPKFSEQVKDNKRTNQISWIKEEKTMYSKTREDHIVDSVKSLSESDSLRLFHQFLQNMATFDEGGEELKEVAMAMMDHLSFIGKKEYDEAAKGIADYWKQCLNNNKKLQIMIELPSTTVDSELVPYYFYKSDYFLLDNILRNFSNEELNRYRQRIVWNESKIKAQSVEDIKWVVIDDWTISGKQLSHTGVRNGRFVSSLHRGVVPEIQLIVGRQNQIKQGFKYKDNDNPCLLRSYYLAHTDEKFSSSIGQSGQEKITGYHSSVDYCFEDVVQEMARTQGVLMPPLTNIFSPYRKKTYTPKNISRWINTA